MASTIFHHWLDLFRALPWPLRYGLRAAMLTGLLVLAFIAGVVAGQRWYPPHQPAAQVHGLATRNGELQHQLQALRRQQKTAATTVQALRATLASRAAELHALKRQEAVYARLIGLDGDRSGLGIHSVTLTPVAGTRAWNFVATLVNTARHAKVARGTLTLAVQGVRNGKLVSLDWKHLAGAAGGKGMAFAFRFFQQVSGSFMLPEGFVPDHVSVTLHPHTGKAVTRKLRWRQTLASHASVEATP